VVESTLSKIVPKTVLVIGDPIVDRYVWGHVDRISPEAPVPVVRYHSEQERAGGAGNPAVNLVALGMTTRFVGRVGDDLSGQRFIELLQKEGVDTSGVVVQQGSITPTKTRVIAGSQQLLRIDNELPQVLSQSCEEQILDQLEELFVDVSCVAISDYAKGTLSDRLLKKVFELSNERGIPTITDPKGTDFKKYTGTTVLKPNARETLQVSTRSSIEEAAEEILETVGPQVLMVTRSEEGISLFFSDKRVLHFPVFSEQVCDVTGAGDTVLATMCAALASGIAVDEAVVLANIAASCAIKKIGCARISLADIAERIVDTQTESKVCSKERFEQLFSALRKEKVVMVRMPSQPSMLQLLSLSQTAKKFESNKVIAYFEEKEVDEKLLELISSLQSLHLVAHGVESFSPDDSHLMIKL